MTNARTITKPEQVPVSREPEKGGPIDHGTDRDTQDERGVSAILALAELEGGRCETTPGDLHWSVRNEVCPSSVRFTYAGQIPTNAQAGEFSVTCDADTARVVEACTALPPAEGVYHYPDYVTNVLLTVLDLRMHNVAVNKSITHYWDHRWDEVRTIEQLSNLLDRYPDDKVGNTAQYLWGNNHWTRIHWLRGLVTFLVEGGLTDQETLREWAHQSEFHRDFEGRVKHLGIAAYKWLAMRLGVETVKPDGHLHAFVEAVIGRRLTDAEIVRLVEEASHCMGLPPRQLDARIWEYQRGGPGTI